jgi:aspartokinase-like uncharacterized kinase
MSTHSERRPSVQKTEVVFKLGGRLLSDGERFNTVVRAIEAAAPGRRLLIIPGGGPFADAVREADRRVRLSADVAHWMAILAMDQYAHLIAGRLRGAVLVADRQEIDSALAGPGAPAGATGGPDRDAGLARPKIPVLAPYRWLREADPLPHSWDVTSDSIAAWVAGQLGARRLILVKPAGAAGELVDPFFRHALPPGIEHAIVTADQLERLESEL